MNKSFEFIGVIEACGLTDLSFHGKKFTWCKHRSVDSRIWKRIHREMVNDEWPEIMSQSNITHLSSIDSDHCSFLLEIIERQERVIKYFKFLNCRFENPSFITTVKRCWDIPVEVNPMWKFHIKMKRVSHTLRN